MSAVKPKLLALLAPALLNLALPAWAGRPLAADDAATTEAGTCQVETWVERNADERAWIVAPACGLAPGLELGADHARLSPRDTTRALGGLALKVAPESWHITTLAGELSFGVKLGASFDRPADAGWQRNSTGALVLATLAADEAWAAHANLGTARDRASGTTATLLNLALVWTPVEQGLLFVEALGNNRRDVFGGTTHAVGGRWWLSKDVLGLDLSASRTAGSGSGTTWSLGLGWYGLKF